MAYVVANNPILVPRASGLERVFVGAGPDAADDWIVERVGRGAIVITSGVPLASRSVTKGAEVLAPRGKPPSECSIGTALATRSLMDQLRSAGQTTSGPALRPARSLSFPERSRQCRLASEAIRNRARSGLTLLRIGTDREVVRSRGGLRRDDVCRVCRHPNSSSRSIRVGSLQNPGRQLFIRLHLETRCALHGRRPSCVAALFHQSIRPRSQ